MFYTMILQYLYHVFGVFGGSRHKDIKSVPMKIATIAGSETNPIKA